MTAQGGRNGLPPHPDIEKLIEYDADVLPAGERDAIRRHLEDCGECRSELERIHTPSPHSAEPDPVLAGLLAGMKGWESAPARDAAVKAGFRSELTPFLGADATAELLRAVSTRGEDLLSRIEPVLSLFLGGRAANALIDQIVTHSVLRAG